MSTLQDLSSQLSSLSKQVSFSAAQAITSTVRKIESAQKVALKRNLDNPTPFTVNSVKSRGARKGSLTGRVFVMDTAANYLEPYELGGQQHLNSKALLNPKSVRLNKYGNLSRNALSQIKAKPDTFFGDVGGVNGVWQRRKAKKVKKNKKRAKRSPNGTRRDRSKDNRAPKLLIRFGDAQQVDAVLNYQERANTMADALLSQEMSKALDSALKTAR